MTFLETITLIEEYTGTQSSTSSSYPLSSKTRDINLALDAYNIIAERASGRWQSADDTNHLDYPITYINTVSGVGNYQLKEDQQGNQILNIYKVRIKTPDGTWNTLEQVDFESNTDADFETTGTPTKFNLTADGIFLSPIPNYTTTGTEADLDIGVNNYGVEVWYSRTNSYFTVSDTTKEAGIPNIFHEYLAIKPAYKWLLRNEPQKASLYRADLEKMEREIGEFHSLRNRSEKRRIIPNIENTR